MNKVIHIGGQSQYRRENKKKGRWCKYNWRGQGSGRSMRWLFVLCFYLGKFCSFYTWSQNHAPYSQCSYFWQCFWQCLYIFNAFDIFPSDSSGFSIKCIIKIPLLAPTLHTGWNHILWVGGLFWIFQNTRQNTAPLNLFSSFHPVTRKWLYQIYPRVSQIYLLQFQLTCSSSAKNK